VKPKIEIKAVDYGDPVDQAALVSLLDMYARDPMGGGQALTPAVKLELCEQLAGFYGAVSFLALVDGKAVGLLNAFLGFSTFKAKPLMNVHDIAVLEQWRGQGVGQALLQAIEVHAQSLGCCKLTLEVLSGNAPARRTYRAFGFEDYALDPKAGLAGLMQKWLVSV
jgi:ribosomal protein S18 acetylase RimI-like enzyme